MKFHGHRGSICPQEGAQQASRTVWINSGLKRRRILRFSTREALIRAISIRECVAVDNRFAVTCNDHGHETVRGGALSAWNVDEVNERFKLAFRYSRNDLFARRYCAPLRQHSVDETTHIISRTVRYFSGLHIVTSLPPFLNLINEGVVCWVSHELERLLMVAYKSVSSIGYFYSLPSSVEFEYYAEGILGYFLFLVKFYV